MENQVLIPKEVQTEVEGFVKHADSIMELVIKDQETFDQAGEYLRGLTAREKAVKEKRLALIKPFKDGIDGINNFFKKLEDSFAAAKDLTNKKMVAYSQEQERLRKEAEAKLRDQQAKEAEKLAKKADNLEEKGKSEQADIVRQQSINTSLLKPTIATTVEKPVGVRKLVTWKCQVVDPALVPREYLMPDEVAIRKVVSALKENTKIPGVKVWSEESFSSTGR